MASEQSRNEWAQRDSGVEAAVQAEILLQGPVALSLAKPIIAKPTLRDPALGILIAVIVSALLWPVLALLWIYVLR